MSGDLQLLSLPCINHGTSYFPWLLKEVTQRQHELAMLIVLRAIIGNDPTVGDDSLLF
jgi:hypothetical protein